MSASLRILLIVRDFGDMPNPNAYRWNAVAAAWRQNGHHIDVVQLAQGGGAAPRTATAPSAWVKGLKKLVRTIYWPDGNFLFIPKARKEALALAAAHDYDIMLSVCLPFSAHWVALSVKKRYPDLYWVADIEDPFSLPGTQAKNNTRIYRKINERAESTILKRADKITFTVSSCVRSYLDFFPALSRQKAQVVPPLFDQRTWEESLQAKSDYKVVGKINFAYIGSFYTRLREPEVLFRLWQDCLQQQPAWRKGAVLHVFGPVFEARQALYKEYQQLLGDALVVHGPISRQEVMAASRAMDALVNLGNTTSFQLPSKTPDYLATGLPIINLEQNEDCAFSAALSAYPGLIRLPVNRGVDAWINMSFERVDENRVGELLVPYQIESVAEGFLT